MERQNIIKHSEDFFVDADFAPAFNELGLNTIDDIFNFTAATELAKANIGKHRTRLCFDITEPDTTLFLKHYKNPPKLEQIKNWLQHGKKQSTADFDRLPSEELDKAAIKSPKVIAYGSQFDGLFEKRSFVITEKIPNAESIERKLPDFITGTPTPENAALKKDFINALADLARRFHDTGMCHRDFYFAHIFLNENGEFYLIDLQRTFKPRIFALRYRIKDLTQLYYSAPGNLFSRTDRLRFYLKYTNKRKIGKIDRLYIRWIKKKAWRMADHDIRHNREVPFAM